MNNKDKYVNKVLKYIKADRKNKRRIREDLMVQIDLLSDNISYEDIIAKYGEPKEMANEFMDNLDYPKKYYGVTIGLSRRARSYEYVSKTKLFGIPLLHINVGGRYGISIAKGIFAVGDVAFGLFSLGGISLGLISIGGISLGILAVAGVSLGLLSIGGVAIGYYAIGAVAIGIAKAVGTIIKLLAIIK